MNARAASWWPRPAPRPATDPVLAADVCRQLCEVFGLTAERTRRITIDLEAGHVASVTVDQYVTRGQAGELVELATRYGLHRAEPARALSPGFTVTDTRVDRCAVPGCICGAPQ